MSIAFTSDQWWKNGVVYCLDAQTFLDKDGDGVGDLAGLIDRIDYLAGIGVSTLWLMPFYPTPDQDDGYDISDFYGVDPRLGTLGEFVEVVRTARDRGMRVIVDLVVNHTSDQHPWFQEARSDPDSPYRDWYVWADERPEDPDLTETFPGDQGGVWTFDRRARQYYLHRFYKHQPDLNVANPAVREEIARIVGFWLQLGVSGFRVDAVPFLIELDGIEGAPSIDPHRYLKDLRSFVERRHGEAILLGEVNLPPKDQRAFFGDEDGDELNRVFNFSVMQRIYLALVRQDLPIAAGWASPLRGGEPLVRSPEDQHRGMCAMADIGDPASGADPTLPYFSTNPTDPDVHHLFSDCPSGQQIPPENREEGTNGWPLCDHCRRLAPAGG